MTVPAPWICLVTDRRAAGHGARTTSDELLAVERQVDEAMVAGVDLVQVRERDLDAVRLRALVARLCGRSPAGTRIVVNDRADVARAAGAAGVHVRDDGPEAERVRSLGPPGWTVGRSIHAAGDARQAADLDYLIFGTVFPSRSKPADAPIAGLEGLRAAAAASLAPMLAIGGVIPARAAACRAAGAAGIAAISAFLPRGCTPDALGPAAAVAAFREAWTEDLRT